MNFSIKPQVPYRKTIAPSTFYNVKCPRCLWLDYWHGFKIPTNLSLQSTLSRFQEKTFDDVNSSQISDKLPQGRVKNYKSKILSTNLSFNGKTTQWKLYGQLDLLAFNEDGTVSIIDCKVSLKKDEQSLVESYWTQLEAYAFMLENPDNGQSLEISTIGLLQWRLNESSGISTPGFIAESKYIPLKRDRNAFHEFMERFLQVIEGDLPESSSNCETCTFLNLHLSIAGFHHPLSQRCVEPEHVWSNQRL